LHPVHESMLEQDPLFYMHLAAWYAGLHIQPSERAQAILFDDNPPEDSFCFTLAGQKENYSITLRDLQISLEAD
jgi:hypothetical protein